MKRINIETEKPYKMGDAPTKEDVPLRDGKFFYRYDKTRTYTREPREGCYFEYWYTAEQLEQERFGKEVRFVLIEVLSTTTKEKLIRMECLEWLGQEMKNITTEREWQPSCLTSLKKQREEAYHLT
jgi:hypothetical protein